MTDVLTWVLPGAIVALVVVVSIFRSRRAKRRDPFGMDFNSIPAHTEYNSRAFGDGFMGRREPGNAASAFGVTEHIREQNDAAGHSDIPGEYSGD
jgi:hypothetical protein